MIGDCLSLPCGVDCVSLSVFLCGDGCGIASFSCDSTLAVRLSLFRVGRYVIVAYTALLRGGVCFHIVCFSLRRWLQGQLLMERHAGSFIVQFSCVAVAAFCCCFLLRRRLRRVSRCMIVASIVLLLPIWSSHETFQIA